MASCDKMIEPKGYGPSYPCSVPLKDGQPHEGPCAANELLPTMEARKQWLAAEATRRKEAAHQASGLGEFQGVPRTLAESLHADPSAITTHPAQPVDCPMCEERPMLKDLGDHMRSAHAPRPEQAVTASQRAQSVEVEAAADVALSVGPRVEEPRQGLFKFQVTKTMVVSVWGDETDAALALGVANAIWAHGDHDTLAKHQNKTTIERLD